MTNTIYFPPVNRDYWSASASTSANETPRSSSVEDRPDPIVEASRRSSSSLIENLTDDLNTNFSPPTAWSDGVKWKSSKLERFSFKELKIATNKFHPDNILGRGGFGSVFKGWIEINFIRGHKLPERIPVAVKALEPGSKQGHKEWQAEVIHLGHLYHPRLIRLFGHYADNKRHLLVYEFMPLGSLDKLLFRDGCLLSWSIRMKIALGVAKGLAFLHRPEINVIHRCVTSSNILLDSNYDAKLSDFGLAMDGPTGNMTDVSTTISGSFGYLAPEYAATGNVSAKSDVYSFGIVLVEILSGQKATDTSSASGEPNFVEWAMLDLNNQKIFRVLDRNLEVQCLLGSAQKACNLAHQCIATEAKLRPNMDQVVIALEQL